MASPPPARSASKPKGPPFSWTEIGLVVLIVGFVLLSGYSAQQLAEEAVNSAVYVPSHCVGSCLGYTPSSYAPGSADAIGGPVLAGILIAVAAYYLGKGSGRKETAVAVSNHQATGMLEAPPGVR